MSDLFIGEMLVLVLLIPVLLRPFFRRLQIIGGIPILPLLAVLSCCAIIAGSGFRLSFMPVLFFTLLVFFTGFSRLIKLFRKLPTDWFPPLTVVWYCVLLLVLVPTVDVSWKARPELSWLPQDRVTTSSLVRKVSAGIVGRYTIREPVDTGKSGGMRKVAILAGNGISRIGARATLSWILADEGWTVIEASYRSSSDYRNFLFSIPFIRDACVLGGTVISGKPFLTDESETDAAAAQNLERLVKFAYEEYGTFVPLFVAAEGSGVRPLASYMTAHPDSFAGAVCILPEKEAATFVVGPAMPVLHATVSGIMPPAAGTYRFLALSGDDAFLYGHGEVCADDVLAASFLGGKRDVGRKQAEIAGRRIATWFETRRLFHEVK